MRGRAAAIDDQACDFITLNVGIELDDSACIDDALMQCRKDATGLDMAFGRKSPSPRTTAALSAGRIQTASP